MKKFEVGKTYLLIHKDKGVLKSSRRVTVHARVTIDGIKHVVIQYYKHWVGNIVVRPIEIEGNNETFFVGKNTMCIAEYEDVTEE